MAQNEGAGHHKRALRGFARGGAMVIGMGLLFSLWMMLFSSPLSALFLSSEAEALPLCASYLRIIGGFYFLSFTGHTFVGWYRGSGRMNITFIGTTLQIVTRVVCTYLLVGALGLDAVGLSSGVGWVRIVVVQVCVCLLERRRDRRAAA